MGIVKVNPPAAELVWMQELQFGATTGAHAIVVDGNSVGGPSPVQLLAISIAGCMAADVVDILRKGRHPLHGLRAVVTIERAAEPPRRLTAVALMCHIRGDVPAAAVQRAMALSHQKYCSVWHSLRQDIPLTTSFDVDAETDGGS